jgi:phage/plasmid-associated DNA primase
MRRDYFQFDPSHKLWLAANHKPNIRGSDYAIWRRIRLIPFGVHFDEDQRDKALGDKLKAELPGILRWAVDGCLAWQADGLGLPAAVDHATASYREDEDHVGRFLADTFEAREGSAVAAKRLRELYVEWCEEAGDRPWSGKAVGKVLTERGLQRHKMRDGWWWVGIRVSEGEDVDDLLGPARDPRRDPSVTLGDPSEAAKGHGVSAGQSQLETHEIPDRDPCDPLRPSSASDRARAGGVMPDLPLDGSQGSQGSRPQPDPRRHDDLW